MDLDLEKYFDIVNHTRLIQILSQTIKDGRVVSLIYKCFSRTVTNEVLKKCGFISALDYYKPINL